MQNHQNGIILQQRKLVPEMLDFMGFWNLYGGEGESDVHS